MKAQSNETNQTDGAKRPRIFLGLSDICGYYSQLERGLRTRGLTTMFVNAFPSTPYERATSPDTFGRVIEWLGRKRNAAKRGTVQRKMWMAVQAVALPAYGVTTLWRFDVFIFASGQSFLLGRDRKILQFFGKRVISVSHGSDARPPFLNGAVVDTKGPIDGRQLASLTRKMKKFVRSLEESSDLVINHPLSAQFHEHPFVNWMKIGIPTAPARRPASTEPPADPGAQDDREVVIVHAPTRPGPKGTAEIERAIESLRRKGYRIRFEKIVGRPNTDVLEALRTCDFVVDELYSDSPMAGFATEAAFFGKPAIVGSYGHEFFAGATAGSKTPISLVCNPENVEGAIETLLTDVELRHKLGASAKEFVEQHWSAERVAERFEHLIQGDVPESWWFDPQQIAYVYGWGLPVSRLKESVNALLSATGRAGLHL